MGGAREMTEEELREFGQKILDDDNSVCYVRSEANFYENLVIMRQCIDKLLADIKGGED